MKALTFSVTMTFTPVTRPGQVPLPVNIQTDIDPTGFTMAEIGVGMAAVTRAVVDQHREIAGSGTGRGEMVAEYLAAYTAEMHRTAEGDEPLGDGVAGRIGPA